MRGIPVAIKKCAHRAVASRNNLLRIIQLSTRQPQSVTGEQRRRLLLKCKRGRLRVRLIPIAEAAALSGMREDAQLLLDHPHLDFRLHVSVQTDCNAIDAQRLDRLSKLNLAALNLESLRFELVRDVCSGDRAK